MKKRAIIISAMLSVSLLLTGCSWDEIKSKFTGEDTSTTATSGSAIVVEDYDPEECVTVPEYKGIEVDCTVTDDEVQAEIDSFLSENSTENKKKKGTCKSGDSVNIDYVGKKDGEAFDGGSATDQTITLGSSGFIDGFDDGVIGMKVGETKDLSLTFPEDYSNSPDLAGQDVIFTVTVNYISVTKTPKMTDKLVAKKTDCKTIDEWKKAKISELQQEKKDNAGSTAYSELEEKTEVTKYPETLVEVCKAQLDAYYKYSATQYGYSDFNEFLSAMQMDQASYDENIKSAAESIAKTQMLAEAIAARENITVTDEEITQEIATAATQSGQEEADLKKSFEELYGSAITIEDYYRVTLLTNKVVDFIGENATIKES